MAQYKIKWDYWDVRYIGIWFLITNILLILGDYTEKNIIFEGKLWLSIIYTVLSVIIVPYIILFIDGPINKILLDFFGKHPVRYSVFGASGIIFCLGFLLYKGFSLYLSI